jgi:hypothetical protein
LITTGFFRSSVPIPISASMFSFVAMSTDDVCPTSESSCNHTPAY